MWYKANLILSTNHRFHARDRISSLVSSKNIINDKPVKSKFCHEIRSVFSNLIMKIMWDSFQDKFIGGYELHSHEKEAGGTSYLYECNECNNFQVKQYSTKCFQITKYFIKISYGNNQAFRHSNFVNQTRPYPISKISSLLKNVK